MIKLILSTGYLFNSKFLNGLKVHQMSLLSKTIELLRKRNNIGERKTKL